MVREMREGSTGLVVTIDEDMIHAAAQIVCEAGYGSSFVIGKKLGIGYNTSSNLIGALQEAGILGEFDLETRRFPLIRSMGFEARDCWAMAVNGQMSHTRQQSE